MTTPVRCPAMLDGTQCNLVAGHQGPHQPPPDAWAAPAAVATKAPRKTVSFKRAMATIFGLIVVLIVIGALSKPTPGTSSQPVAPAPAAAWQPAGFSLTTDQDVAYRWLGDSEFECEIVDHCWGMFVVSKNGCSSLYVELAILDDAGNNVGYTNDLASGVAAGQQAKLVFPNLETGASKARISKVTCV